MVSTSWPAFQPGDAFVPSRITHDGKDAAVLIRTNCHRALDEGGAFFIVEAVFPERARDLPAAIRSDLSMLILLYGRERTAPEFEQLPASAGFPMTKVIPTKSPVGLGIIGATKSA
jgi:hypothetical protein